MSEEVTEKQTELIAEITFAFDGVQRGSGTSLPVAEWCNRWVYCGRDEQSEEAKIDLRTRRSQRPERVWQELPVSEIESNTGLIHLDAEGLRYYLPAFLCWIVRSYSTETWTKAPISFTLFLLCGSKRHSHLKSYYDATFSAFSLAQKKAVLHFLDYILITAESGGLETEVRDIQHAIENYWKQFDTVETGQKKRPRKK